MNAPLTTADITLAKLTNIGTHTNAQIRAFGQGQNEIRQEYREVSTDTVVRAEKMWEAATEAEMILTTKKLGNLQQARWAGRLHAALGHLG